MLPGIIIGASLVIAALMFVRMGDAVFGKDRYFIGFSAVALVIVGVVVTVVVTGDSDDPGPGDTRAASGIALDEMARVTTSLRDPEPTVQSAERIAPVPSLLDGLKRRLEAAPDDARGWALLAQSYAFVGEMDLADQAVDRAVSLGFDEADLKQRVASARRDPHAGLPGFAAAD